MRLKLLAPFLSPRFSLRSALVAHEPVEYEKAWRSARDLYQETPPEFGALAGGRVQARFEHTGNTEEGKRSRYRTIASHSLARPLPVLELQVTATGDVIVEMLRESFPDRRDQTAPLKKLVDGMANELKAGNRIALLRVYDHRVSMLQLDFEIELDPSDFERKRSTSEPDASPVNEEGLRKTLDDLQQGAILFTEKLVALYHGEVLVPMFNWIREDTEVGRQFIDDEETAQVSARFLEDMAQQRCRTLWVTRSLIFEKKENLAADFRQALVESWLKDVPDDGQEAPGATEQADSKTKEQPKAGRKEQADAEKKKQADVKKKESTRWLTYLFAEDTYSGDYPEQGWLNDNGRARSFSPTWDAMETAQYYYSAFDLVQTSVSHILAVSLSRTGEHKVNEMQWLLDLAIREAQMLRVEYYENKKYYSRQVAKKLDEILKYWGFENLLEKQTEQRVEACVERLTELNARAAERSAILTDLVLLAIGVTSVFGVGLALAEYGRAQTLDPALIPYEGVSFNVAQWIAARSTDDILLASLGMSLALIAIYAVFRMLKYKA